MRKHASLLALLILTPVVAFAPPDPLWWSQEPKIIDAAAQANNYAPVNLGQLKNVAMTAYSYLDHALSQFGGAGFPLSLASDSASNYSPVNVGQLKAIALPFYDRLKAPGIGYNTKQNLIDHGYPADWAYDYPWDNVHPVPPSENYAPANIGQLKMVFSFDLTLDTDGDTMPDWWEDAHQLNKNNSGDAATDFDNDGVSNQDEFLAGSDPHLDDDSDHDGTTNSADLYPLDNRRTKEIPELNYASIDISTPIAGEVEINDVAIDDQGHVGFFWRDNDNNSHSVSWSQGQISSMLLPSVYQRSEIEGDYLKFEYFAYSPGAVNAGGTLAGTFTTGCWLFGRSYDGDPGPFMDPPPDPNYPDYNVDLQTAWLGEERAFQWAGSTLPTVAWPLFYPEGSLSGGRGITNYNISWGWTGDVYGDFIGTDWFPSETHPELFHPTVVSTNGNAAGERSTFDEQQGWQPSKACWSNGFFYIFGAPDMDSTIYGIDDAREVLGLSTGLSAAAYCPDAPAGGDHPFWFSGNSVEDFYFVLPEEFRRQIRFDGAFDPFFNSAGDMVFPAIVATGTAEELPGWASTTLLWQRSTNTVKQVIMPAGVYMRGAGCDRFNQNLVMVGTSYEPLSGEGLPTRRAKILLPMEIDSSRATIQPTYRGSHLSPDFCDNYHHRQAGEKIKGALTIYHNAVRDAEGETEDFDVTLKVTSTYNTTWTKVSGPDSGTLVNANSPIATFRNPKKGGLYEFQLAVDGETVEGKVQLWLPVAGPDISTYWQSQINYFKDTWGPAYQQRLNNKTALLAFNPPYRYLMKLEIAGWDMSWMGGDLDWQGQIIGNETPCGSKRGQHPFGNNATLQGFVIHYSKRNNMLFALIGREMGLWEKTIISMGNIYNVFSYGTQDPPEATEAYHAGFDLFNGMSLENVMKAHGLKMHEPNGWDEREWPSHETSDTQLTCGAQYTLEQLIK